MICIFCNFIFLEIPGAVSHPEKVSSILIYQLVNFVLAFNSWSPVFNHTFVEYDWIESIAWYCWVSWVNICA